MEIKDKIKLSRDVMLISGIFCVFTSLLLILNFIQMSGNEPLESETLKNLIERLVSDQNNEALKEDIRNLDLLARKAYFTAQWQVKTGAWLLLAGSLVFGLALWFNRKLLSGIDKPDMPEHGELIARLTSQKWILYTVGFLLVAALIASFFSNDYLSKYQPEIIASAAEPEEQIKLLHVSRNDAVDAAEVVTEDAPVPVSVEEGAEPEEKTTPVVAKERVQLTAELLYQQHNSFRGAFGHGISRRKSIPVDWDGESGKNIIWETPVPLKGYNSPVIWDDKIFLTGANDNTRMVYCIHRETGKLLWEGSASGIPGSPSKPPEVTDDTGLAAPSVAVDGNAVYAIFGTGDLIAFDLDGNRLWARNLGVPDNHYGHSSSLIVWDGKLIVQYDTNRGGRLLAVNTLNGESFWDNSRNNRISWASPILANINGKYQIITSCDPKVAAHDLETGQELWAIECMMGEIGPSPAYYDGLVYAANEYSILAAIKPGNEPEILWEDNEYLPETASPVVSDGLLFIATSYGVIVCYDAKTGEKYWEFDASNGFYSSPVIAEGKLYVIDLGGEMYIFEASATKNLISKPVLGERAYATPAFTDGRIFLRGANNLYCIGIK